MSDVAFTYVKKTESLDARWLPNLLVEHPDELLYEEWDEPMTFDAADNLWSDDE